jgi:hypothetical protein
MKTLSHPELLVRLLSAVGLGSNLLCSNAACGNEVAPKESIADAATTGEAASDAAQMADADAQTDTSDEAIASDATPTADGDSSLDLLSTPDGFAARIRRRPMAMFAGRPSRRADALFAAGHARHVRVARVVDAKRHSCRGLSS